MAHVLLFHHVMGLTDGVKAFAERLRRAGHKVEVPDLFGGRVFHSIEAGMEHARLVGDDQIAEAGMACARGLPPEVVYAGFSMGVAPAMKLVQQRAGARGALFLHGIVPLGYFGDQWPSGVPLQIHITRDDPYEDPAEVRKLAQSAHGDLFEYETGAHLFTDSSREGYDPEATDLVVQRSLEFLGRLSNRAPAA